ncbi:MAG: hypothetical protein J7K85_06235 [Anaerolineaceae bacterium]|nr:hypothetical protein [Anaerolineaceae bacterium]
MTKVTIFTSPKPFNINPHINIIQHNAIESWTHLGEDVDVVIIGDEEGMEEIATELHIKHVKYVRCNEHGTPMIPSLFDIASEVTDSPILAFANADVIITRNLIDSAISVHEQEENYLLVGQRYDIEITEPIIFDEDWQENILAFNQVIGHLHGTAGSDYFIFPRHCFVDVPDLVIGRAGWDNWMIFEARRRGWKTIDCTESITILHQNHDYSHLPGGQVHYRLPESNENVQAAGGFLTVFTLIDADYKLVDGKIVKRKATWTRFWREVEICPLVKLNSKELAKVFFYIFNPRRGWLAFVGWIERTFGKTISE